MAITCMGYRDTNGREKEIINLGLLKPRKGGEREADIVRDREGDFGVVVKEGCDSVKVKYPDGRIWDRSHLYRTDDQDVVNYIHQREEELDYAKELLGYESARERLKHRHNRQMEFDF